MFAAYQRGPDRPAAGRPPSWAALKRSFRELTILSCVLTLGGVFLIGCSIGSVSDRSGSKYEYWYALTKPIVSDRLRYEDDRIFIQFGIDESFVKVWLLNISDQALSVHWDRVTFVVDGVITPFKYSENAYTLDPDQWNPTVIPPYEYAIDFLVPADNIRVRNGIWVEQDLFPTRDFGSEDLRNEILQNIGKSIAIFMPLNFGEEVNEYVFGFEVAEIEKLDWEKYHPPKRRVRATPPKPGIDDSWTAAVMISVFIITGAYFVFIRESTAED